MLIYFTIFYLSILSFELLQTFGARPWFTKKNSNVKKNKDKLLERKLEQLKEIIQVYFYDDTITEQLKKVLKFFYDLLSKSHWQPH